MVIVDDSVKWAIHFKKIENLNNVKLIFRSKKLGKTPCQRLEGPPIY